MENHDLHELVQDYRVRRLADALAEKFDGDKTKFGRALGYKSGAFLRQMLDRERPVREKIVMAIEALPGMAGWFGSPVQVEGGSTLILTEEERDWILGARDARRMREQGVDANRRRANQVILFPDRRSPTGYKEGGIERIKGSAPAQPSDKSRKEKK